MIDFAHVEKYKENNRIEAKKALGGLPKSIWETYSAFANTLGGIILLGVEEYRDKSFHLVDLPEPERLVKEFSELVNDPRKASKNILSDKDVTIEEIDGKHIVAIRVPRAKRSDKPIFIDGDPMCGSYRRGGEGDYRCTREEVEAMLRDATLKTADMAVLEETDIAAINKETLNRYRKYIAQSNMGELLSKLSDNDLLLKLGAIAFGKDKKLRPTSAGLLMFGYKKDILLEYPQYELKYKEDDNEAVSFDGNICDFYFDICERLQKNREPSVANALREALVNCLVNADYFSVGGIEILNSREKIELSNSGSFRIDIETAKSGGISDPRNGALVKMFNIADIGKSTGSGIPSIFRIWKKQGWNAPKILESFDPNRITLSLEMKKTEDILKENKKRSREELKNIKAKMGIGKQAIAEYLTEQITATDNDIAALLGTSPDKAKKVLREMLESGMITEEKDGEITLYKLKM